MSAKIKFVDLPYPVEGEDDVSWEELGDVKKLWLIQRWEILCPNDPLPEYAQAWKKDTPLVTYKEEVVTQLERDKKDMAKLEQTAYIAADLSIQQSRMANALLAMMVEHPNDHHLKRRDLYRSMMTNNVAYTSMVTAKTQWEARALSKKEVFSLLQGRIKAKLIDEHNKKMADLDNLMHAYALQADADYHNTQQDIEEKLIDAVNGRKCVQEQLQKHRLTGGLKNVGLIPYYAESRDRFAGKIHLNERQITIIKKLVLPLFKDLAQSKAKAMVNGKEVAMAKEMYEQYMSKPYMLETDFRVENLNHMFLQYNVPRPPEYVNEIGYQGEWDNFNFRDVYATWARSIGVRTISLDCKRREHNKSLPTRRKQIPRPTWDLHRLRHLLKRWRINRKIPRQNQQRLRLFRVLLVTRNRR